MLHKEYILATGQPTNCNTGYNPVKQTNPSTAVILKSREHIS
jgi:hypothetical protein